MHEIESPESATLAVSEGKAIKGRCLVALNSSHIDLFLGEALMQELEQTVGEVRRLSCGPADEEQLRQVVNEFQPEVVLAGWSTPRIPEDLTYPNGPVRYICNVTGSIRPKVSYEQVRDGVLVTNWGTSISRTIAECALMMVLMCLRRTAMWHEEMHHNGGWAEPSHMQGRQLSLFERKVGLHGFGKIARELVELMRPFKVEVSTYCPTASDDQLAEYGVKRANSLEELFSSNHVLVELEGLTDKTYHSVTEEILRLIPDEGVLVNVGRGAVIDEEALARVAAEGKIRVALDVFEKEPLPLDSPLRKNTNVVIMPHQAGPTPDRTRDSGKHAVRNIQNYFAGRPLTGEVTEELYQYMT